MGTVSTGGWHYIVVTFNGSSATFYIDGLNSGSTNGNYSIPNDTTVTNSTIGNWIKNSTVTNPLNGQIDQLRVYDYVRTPAQITWEYNRGAPFAYYQLNDCTGTTAYNAARTGDNKATGNDGTINLGSNGVTSAGTCITSGAWANGASGKHGASLSFDGSDDYISIGTSLINNNDTFTISSWVKTTDTTLGNNVYKERNTASNTPLLGVKINENTIGDVEFQYMDNAGTWCGVSTGNVSINDGNWHHIDAIQESKSSRKLYVDGVLKGTNTTTCSTITTNNAYIGVEFRTSFLSYYSGQIDDVKIYNYALTAEQVKTDMTGAAVRFE
jgi:hypothetical protein